MSSVETGLRLVASAGLVGAGAYLSYWGAARLTRGESLLVRLAATMIVGMALATVAFHAIMPVRLFNLPTALSGAALLLAAVLSPDDERRLVAAAWRRDGRVLCRWWRLLVKSPRRGWFLAFAVCAVPILLRPLMIPPVSWDGIMYHLPKAALWVQNGGAPAINLDPGIPSWLLTRNHLAGGEVLIAWAMLPMHGDAFAGLPSLVQWLGLAPAVLFLAREIGVREPFGTAAAAFALALPPMRLQVGSGYVELTLALTLVLGVAFALRYMRTGAPASLLLALAAMGLACAVKIIALPVAALVLLFVGAHALRRRVRPAVAAAALGIFVALAAPWFVYNTLDTGAPVSPARVKIAGIELGKDNEAIRRFDDLPGVEGYAPDKEWRALKTTFGSLSGNRESLGWPALGPLAVFFLTLPWLLRRGARAALLLAIVVTNLAIVYSPAFTPWRQFMPESFGRFMLPALLCAIAAAGYALRGWRRGGRLYLGFLLGTTFFLLLRFIPVGVRPFEIEEAETVLLGFGLVASVAVVVRGRARVACVTIAAVVLLVRIEHDRDENRFLAARWAHFLHPVHRNWVDAVKLVDDPARPLRIAVTHGVSEVVDTGLFYFFFGRDLQNRLVHVPVTRDGSFIFMPEDGDERVDYREWVRRILDGGIEYVVSLQPVTLEQIWMERHPERFRRLFGVQDSWGIFVVTGPRDGLQSFDRDWGP